MALGLFSLGKAFIRCWSGRKAESRNTLTHRSKSLKSSFCKAGLGEVITSVGSTRAGLTGTSKVWAKSVLCQDMMSCCCAGSRREEIGRATQLLITQPASGCLHHTKMHGAAPQLVVPRSGYLYQWVGIMMLAR